MSPASSARRRGRAQAWPSIVVLVVLAALAWLLLVRRGVLPSPDAPFVAPTTPRTTPPAAAP